jgi:hypothetical protein
MTHDLFLVVGPDEAFLGSYGRIRCRFRRELDGIVFDASGADVACLDREGRLLGRLPAEASIDLSMVEAVSYGFADAEQGLVMLGRAPLIRRQAC